MDLLYTAHVPPGPGPFKTILALHGWGASAHDLLGLAPILHDGQALVLCPQGSTSFPIGPGMEGHGWFPLARGRPLDLAGLERSAEQLDAFIEGALARYPVKRDSLLLLGFSQGGVLAYRTFLAQPERFAGMVALSSWLPEELAKSLPALAEPTSKPVLVMHGTRDSMVEVERARESRRRLLERRVPLTYHEYDMAHEIAREALIDLCSWIDDKVFAPVLVLG
jgi:phospholipase/carboxylesterase